MRPSADAALRHGVGAGRPQRPNRVTPPTMPKPPLPDALQQVLRNPNPAIIGTVAPDGSPNTVATWYLWEDGRARWRRAVPRNG